MKVLPLVGAVAFAAITVLTTPQPVAACLAFSPNNDTADFEGRPPHNVLLATVASQIGPRRKPIIFSNVVVLRGRTPNRLRLQAADSWSCHPPYFKYGDRVVILGWGRLPLVLPIVWRVGASGEILPAVVYDQHMRISHDFRFKPLVNGREPLTLADVLGPFGIDVPDAATLVPGMRWATPLGALLLGLAAVLALVRRRYQAV